MIGQLSLTELSFKWLWRSIWHALKTVRILKFGSEGQFILKSIKSSYDLLLSFWKYFWNLSWARIPTSQSKNAGPKIKRSPYLKFQGRSQGQLKNKNFDISSKPIVIIMTKPFLLCWKPLFMLFVISFWMFNCLGPFSGGVSVGVGQHRCWWRMLETKCVGDNFEMLVTDSECSWPIYFIEKTPWRKR